MTDLFFELHSGLPRESPGDDASTARAMQIVAPYVPSRPVVLDVGCGPGAQTLILARETAGMVTAIDTHEPFLDELTRRARVAGLEDRIRAVRADMRELPFAPESFDLIWSEGAIFIMGFSEGLRRWKELLKPGSCMVVSELAWITGNPKPEEKQFWSTAYPMMQTDGANRDTIHEAGFELLDEFRLPRASWFTDYYEPLERRAQDLFTKYATDPDAKTWIAQQLKEVDIVRRFSGFAYIFYVFRLSP